LAALDACYALFLFHFKLAAISVTECSHVYIAFFTLHFTNYGSSDGFYQTVPY
jgi:hypothetical protein